MKKYKKKCVLIVAPMMVGFLLLYIVPYVQSVYLSLLRSPIQREFVGFENYLSVLSNNFFQLSIKNSAFRMALDVLSVVGLAFIFSLSAVSMKWNTTLIQTILLLPLVVPGSAASSLFALLGKRIGASGAVRLLYLWKNTGLQTVLLISARCSIPERYLDAARIDGAGKYQITRHIILPLMRGAVGFCALMAVVTDLQIFREVFLLYGAYPPENLYLVQHLMNNLFSKMKYGALTSAGTLVAILLFLPVILGWRMIQRRKS